MKNRIDDLALCRQTNARLNRRCQQLESVIAKNKYYSYAWDEGYEAGKKSEREVAENRLIQYKVSTRRLLKELRENIIDAYNLMMEDDDEDLSEEIRSKIHQTEVEV